MNMFSRQAPAHSNLDAVNATIRQAFASAGLDTATGPMRFVTETIEQALSASSGPTSWSPPTFDADAIDVVSRFVEPGAGGSPPIGLSPDDAAQPRGQSRRHVFKGEQGSRSYMLHVPPEAARPAGTQAPVIVMLHGCTQSADDFARGTDMNRLADTHGFLVVYPEQPASANSSKCWNWFQEQDQVRGRGEPAILAGIVEGVLSEHDGDRRRVFVAGLSAGAAMAVVLAETYPELFAAVGVHSGLPYASARDIPSALAKMKGGRSGLAALRAVPSPTSKAVHSVPTIVFHGDRDHTVHLSNAEEIVAQAVKNDGSGGLAATTDSATTAGGRQHRRTVHRAAEGGVRVEYWTLHGAGHAWSGGKATGSYTDPAGPDASAEMVRFFQQVVEAK